MGTAATERQKQYATRLGLTFPADATAEELNELISMKVAEADPAAPGLIGYARLLGLQVREHTLREQVYEWVTEALTAPGREPELARWYVYAVARDVTGADDDDPRQCGLPARDAEEVAARLLADGKAMKSVRRHRGRELLFFGEVAGPDGFINTGGSRRTAAYQFVAPLVRGITGR